MMSLIIGGSGSGKSAYAEAFMSRLEDVKNKYYLATMLVYDEDARRKVWRHKRLRQGKGFLTVEQPKDIGQAIGKMAGKDNAVLLECMSNLTANEMFGEKPFFAEEVVEKILNGIEIIKENAKHLIIVTNNVFEDGIVYDAGTMEYLRALAEINRRLAAMADEVTEVVVGLPIVIKEKNSG